MCPNFSKYLGPLLLYLLFFLFKMSFTVCRLLGVFETKFFYKGMSPFKIFFDFFFGPRSKLEQFRIGQNFLEFFLNLSNYIYSSIYRWRPVPQESQKRDIFPKSL